MASKSQTPKEGPLMTHQGEQSKTHQSGWTLNSRQLNGRSVTNNGLGVPLRNSVLISPNQQSVLEKAILYKPTMGTTQMINRSMHYNPILMSPSLNKHSTLSNKQTPTNQTRRSIGLQNSSRFMNEQLSYSITSPKTASLQKSTAVQQSYD